MNESRPARWLPRIVEVMASMNLEKSGIIFYNPYQSAYEHVCLELFQLLILVEKIKASKKSLKNLNELVGFQQYLRGYDPIKGFFRSLYDNTEAKEADYIFQMVCDVLDKKSDPNLGDFAKEAISLLNQYRKNVRLGREDEEDKREDFWLTLAPEAINKYDHKLKSLQCDALGYSHLKIVCAYTKVDKFLDTIDKLKDTNDEQIIDTVITQYAEEKHLDKVTVLNEAQRSIHIRHQINQKICLAYSQFFFDSIRPIKELLGIEYKPFDWYFFNVESGEGTYRTSGLEKEKVGQIIKTEIPVELFQRAQSTGTEVILNRYILNSVWAEVNKNDDFLFRGNADETYYQEILSNYAYWASNHNDTLLDIELSKGRRLTFQSILRGLKFSYWFHTEKANRKERFNIGDAVKQYVDTEAIEDSATTVKFSFEAIKRVGKTELLPLLCKQLIWRLDNDLTSVAYSFCPLNDPLYQKLKVTIDNINSVIKPKVKLQEYDDILEWITKIEELLKSGTEAEYLDSGVELIWTPEFATDHDIQRENLKKVLEHKEDLLILQS